jgi:DNA primase
MNLPALSQYVEKRIGPPAKRSGAWLHWRCPMHQDNGPSFAVNTRTQTWRCFGACATGGDLIALVMRMDGCSYQQALNVLGQEPVQTRPAALPAIPQPNYIRWQTRAAQMVAACKSALWSEDGKRALEYLRTERLLSDATIRHYQLGYIPCDHDNTRDEWGLPGAGRVWLPRGIVIPTIAGPVYSLNIRRPSGQPKYYKVPGSRAAPFGYTNTIGLNHCVITEGEFDAMLLDQAEPLCGAVTLGGAASKLDVTLWDRFLFMHKIWVASDTDAAGLQMAAALGEMTRRVQRLSLPAEKDITDFARSGGDLAAWVYPVIREAAR